ncbi:energy-coupling factor transporter transmembrane component T [Wukongibacter baidiensis]|uniref:energy-coupling factor transporter transmembrane component T n=1 Tax=Wukongibacter baidiensis TaxID=1723361 RepID=UPI003D7F920E
MIKEWLLAEDEYIPDGGSNGFIDKSIFSFLKVFSNIRRNRNKERLINKINPTLKGILTIVNILLISLSRSFIYLFIVDIYILIGIFLTDPEERKNIMAISFIFPLVTLIILIPSMLMGNIYNSLMLFQRMISSVLLANILSQTTKWTDISRALKLLFIPDIFIWVMEITLKYIVLLGEYSTNLLYALKLRSIGNNKDKYGSISRIMGNLFLKSYKMSEEMSSAMECRGFVGEYTVDTKSKLEKIDYLYGLINILLIAAFIVTNLR